MSLKYSNSFYGTIVKPDADADFLDRTRVRIVSILSLGPDFIKVVWKRNLGPDFRIFKSGSGSDFIYLVCVIYCCVRLRNWILSNKSGTVSGSGFYQHRFSWTCKVFGPGFGPDFSRLLLANTACVRSFANGTNCIPMPSEILPLAVIGYHWYRWYANGYHWLLAVIGFYHW